MYKLVATFCHLFNLSTKRLLSPSNSPFFLYILHISARGIWGNHAKLCDLGHTNNERTSLDLNVANFDCIEAKGQLRARHPRRELAAASEPHTTGATCGTKRSSGFMPPSVSAIPGGVWTIRWSCCLWALSQRCRGATRVNGGKSDLAL